MSPYVCVWLPATVYETESAGIYKWVCMYESVGNVVMQMRHECVEVRTHAGSGKVRQVSNMVQRSV